MNERNEAIAKFLEAWDNMLTAANEIPDFTCNFKVTISSDHRYIEDRIKAINGINESFTRHNMSWTSSN